MELLLNILQSILAFVVVLSILVFVHEYGHYLGCLICGIKVDSFSIGMGKELWGWTDKNGVRWKISMLPFGGYLKMYGDDDVASGKANKKIINNMSEEDKKVSFYFQNVYKKFIVVFFGPLFNLIFAIILLTIIFRIEGITIIKPIVLDVIQDSPAEIAGIKKDDKILSVNDKDIKSFKEINSIVVVNHLQPLKIKILRNNEIKEITVYPEIKDSKDMFGNDVKMPMIGITANETEYYKLNILDSFKEAVVGVYKMCKDTFIVLGQMITGNRGTEGLGGPIKIAKYSSQSFQGGILTVLSFMALISANLGLMNLLPIPVLDGGHLLFFLIEMITRRSIPEKIQDISLNIGFYLLMAIMLFATINDIKGIL